MFVSSWAKAAVQAWLPEVDQVPATVVPNFVAAPHVAVEPGTGSGLVSTGNLEAVKNHRYLLRVLAAARRKGYVYPLDVFGEGVEREAVEILPRALRSRVHLLGRVSDSVLPGYYAAADVFVAPATGSESFGIVLVEAMAAGLPIVASDIAGYREVVRHGREALLVPSGDPIALGDAVQRLFEHPDEARVLSENGRVRASVQRRFRLVPAGAGDLFAASIRTGNSRCACPLPSPCPPSLP